MYTSRIAIQGISILGGIEEIFVLVLVSVSLLSPSLSLNNISYLTNQNSNSNSNNNNNNTAYAQQHQQHLSQGQAAYGHDPYTARVGVSPALSYQANLSQATATTSVSPIATANPRNSTAFS